MCVISYKAMVSGTKLLVMPSGDGTRQLTVYSNEVDTDRNNSMILPIPGGGEGVQLHDFSKHKALFSQLADMFPKAMSMADSVTYLSNSAGSRLPVLHVGSYDVSVAPTWDDLARLDRDTFNVSDAAVAFMGDTYAKKWGYVVCQLSPHTSSYSPFAYSHPIEYGKCFVPTMHFHGHEEIMADWDHKIYAANCDILKGARTADADVVADRWAALDLPADYTRGRTLQELRRKGRQPNEDMWLAPPVGVVSDCSIA
jgi:hypothetical protein